MAGRRRYEIQISDLVRAGKLRAGGQVHANHHGRRYSAVITKTGALKLPDESEELSPTAAAKKITKGPINGWQFWLVEQPNARPRSLRQLRAELLRDRA
jgi:hypothetical protein